MGKLIDLTDQKFSRLTVVERAGKNKHGQVLWLCKCECGEETVVAGGTLSTGNTKSCGCLKRERTKERRTTHGLKAHPLYAVWQSIKQRCCKDGNKDYSNYGGRGISIYDEWKADFKTFYDWCIDNGWKEGLDIDRRDNDGDYCPENCRFITRQKNACNRRPRKEGSSKYKGVSWNKREGKWVVQIMYNGKAIYIGLFNNEIEAALAYDKAAVECHKECAWLNRDHFEEVVYKLEEKWLY